MLGLLLAIGRLYRDSEMPVLTAIGVGPRRLLRPLMMLVLPVVAVIALCSLWLGPWARDYARGMVEAGNRSLLRSEEHTSELQSLMRISYAVFCLKKKNNK